LIKNDSGVWWHLLAFGKSALRTGDNRIQFHHCLILPLRTVRKRNTIQVRLGALNHLTLTIRCYELVLNPRKFEILRILDPFRRKIIRKSSSSGCVHTDPAAPAGGDIPGLTLKAGEKQHGGHIKSARSVGSDRNGIGRAVFTPVNLIP
jgi:hypothetical protein